MEFFNVNSKIDWEQKYLLHIQHIKYIKYNRKGLLSKVPKWWLWWRRWVQNIWALCVAENKIRQVRGQ